MYTVRRKPGNVSVTAQRREFIGNAIIGAKPGPKWAHRFIGPSIHRLSTEQFLDGEMIRWPDGSIALSPLRREANFTYNAT
jgi:hypothetical protein